MNLIRRTLIGCTICAALAAATGALAPLAAAEPAPAEFSNDFSTLRLINGGLQDGKWQAGLDMQLKPAWKTYWRVPGESGVPPRFDWSASSNVASVQLDMPAPHRFTDANGEGIGYKEEVIFPAVVTPADPAKPVVLALDMFYAVCHDICVPVKAELSLELSEQTVRDSSSFSLKQARKQVPSSASPDGLGVNLIKSTQAEGKPVLEILVTGLKTPAAADIFIETSTTAYLRKPHLAGTADGVSTFHLLADGLPAGTTLKGHSVNVTVTDGTSSLVHRGTVE